MQRGALDAVRRRLESSGMHPVMLYDLYCDGELVVVAVVQQSVQPRPWDRLSVREREVARLAAKALTNGQIARRLGITAHTVNFHLRQIFRKLEISSRVSLTGHIPQ